MSKLTAKIKRDLPLRISLMIVLAMALLLTVTLLVMLHSSRNSMKDDALNRATYTLDRATNNIDNILLSVEETAGNIYFNMMPHLDNPEMMSVFAKKLVETNPYVAGCAIAFEVPIRINPLPTLFTVTVSAPSPIPNRYGLIVR